MTNSIIKQDLEPDQEKKQHPPLFGSCRLVLAVVSYIGIYHLMALRFNLSMAMVCMSTDPTAVYCNASEATPTNYSSGAIVTHDEDDKDTEVECVKDEEKREFHWSKSVQGGILSSFFYGYICTQVVGGYVSDRYGGKSIMLFGMTVLSATTMFVPILARSHIALVVIVRVIQGLASGLAFPALYNLFSVWSGPVDRATLMSFTFSGIPTATVTTFPLTSWLCHSGLDGGWPMAFYVPGATGLVWCVVFYAIIYSKPEDHPRISSEELVYLCGEKGEKKRGLHVAVPWAAMLRSVPVHALWITHLCSAWGWYFIAINFSLFIREALGFKLLQNGLMSSLPFIGMFLLSSTGIVFDFLLEKKMARLSTLRKIFNSIAFLAPAIMFFLLWFLDSSQKVAHVVMISIGFSLHQLALTGGFYLTHSEVAGRYSGVLFGITNTVAQVPGFVNPLLVSQLTTKGTREEWMVVFSLAAILFVIGALVFLFFGVSERQPWALDVLQEPSEHQTYLIQEPSEHQTNLIQEPSEQQTNLIAKMDQEPIDHKTSLIAKTDRQDPRKVREEVREAPECRVEEVREEPEC